MKNLLRFTAILVISLAALLGTLAVGGALSSTQFWHSITKVVEVAAIACVASLLIMLVAKKS